MTARQRYHLIAIGGSVMHNLAIDLSDLGHQVTGSDDEIYEPSRSRLKEKGLLPGNEGWNADNITSDIDMVILGKHAREDNPELARALELGLEIMSFPEFIATQSGASRRVCIAGSHGKTTTTSMIMHVLKDNGHDFDYLVGAQIEGFDKMVRLSGSDLLVVEGDEYPSSVLDGRAKMLHYNPSIAVITGMAWDHVNIYKTYEDYIAVFDRFLKELGSDAVCFFDQEDEHLLELMIRNDYACTKRGYTPFSTNAKGDIKFRGSTHAVRVFGKHNMSNLKAAYHVCQSIGIKDDEFFTSISTFKGASRRMQLVAQGPRLTVYRDFAHAPSKCVASCRAIRDKYPGQRIRGVIELHTFSSLDSEFIKQYAHSMDALDEAFVFFDPHAMEMKRMEPLDPKEVARAFDHPRLTVIDSHETLLDCLTTAEGHCDVLLVMSSGNLTGISLDELFN